MKLSSLFILIIIINTQAMATELTTRILIQASPEKVWEVLTAFEEYADWNPFITEISGDVQVGNKIKINADGMKFKPKVLVYETNQELKWIGRLVMPGIFDGTHRFELIDNGDGTTTLVQSEKFKGILVPFLKKMLMTKTKASFEAMNEALKQRAEERQVALSK